MHFAFAKRKSEFIIILINKGWKILGKKASWKFLLPNNLSFLKHCITILKQQIALQECQEGKFIYFSNLYSKLPLGSYVYLCHDCFSIDATGIVVTDFIGQYINVKF